MEKILVYSFSRCMTCRKAISWLEKHKVPYTLIDIVEDTPKKEMLVQAINQMGGKKKLFNTSGKSYRTLGSKVVDAMSDLEAVKALMGDGKLIKRPFVVLGKERFLVGFKAEAWDEVFSEGA